MVTTYHYHLKSLPRRLGTVDFGIRLHISPRKHLKSLKTASVASGNALHSRATGNTGACTLTNDWELQAIWWLIIKQIFFYIPTCLTTVADLNCERPCDTGLHNDALSGHLKCQFPNLSCRVCSEQLHCIRLWIFTAKGANHIGRVKLHRVDKGSTLVRCAVSKDISWTVHSIHHRFIHWIFKCPICAGKPSAFSIPTRNLQTWGSLVARARVSLEATWIF